MVMIECPQCKQLHPDVDIYMDERGIMRCCDCLGFARRSNDPKFSLDEVIVKEDDHVLRIVDGEEE